jgi:hypothetical protein
MQPGGRGRHRPLVPGIDRLVVGPVPVVGRTPAGDIGRQGQFPEAGDGLVQESPREGEPQPHVAPLPLILDFRIEAHELADRALGLLAEADAVADVQLLGGTREGAPPVRPFPLVEHDFDPGGRFLPDAKAMKPGGNHPGVVEHQGVAGPQQIRQVADDPIVEGLARADHEQPRRVARARGPQRDPVVGQVEIEEVDAHGSLLSPPGGERAAPASAQVRRANMSERG